MELREKIARVINNARYDYEAGVDWQPADDELRVADRILSLPEIKEALGRMNWRDDWQPSQHINP